MPSAACRAWINGERFLTLHWPLHQDAAPGASAAAQTRQIFNQAAKLSEAMLKRLKQMEGLEGPLKAQMFEGASPVGVCLVGTCCALPRASMLYAMFSLLLGLYSSHCSLCAHVHQG